MIFDDEYYTQLATKQVTDNLLFNMPGAVFPDETNDYFYDDFVNLFNKAVEEKKKENADNNYKTASNSLFSLNQNKYGNKSNNYQAAYNSLLSLMKEFQYYLSSRSGAAAIASQSAKEAGERAAADAKAKIEESKARGEAEARAAKEASAKESIRIIEEKTAKVKAGQESEASKLLELTDSEGVDDTRTAADMSAEAALQDLYDNGYSVQIDPNTGNPVIVKKNDYSKWIFFGGIGLLAYILLKKKKAGK